MRAADAQDDGEDRGRSPGAEYRPGRDVDGIDLAVIAHTDLALGLGVPLQLDQRDFFAARGSRRRPAAARGKAAGCAVANPEHGRQWVAKGSRPVLCSGDIWLLGGALGIERLREWAQAFDFNPDRKEVAMRILSAIGNWRGFETTTWGRLRPLAGLGLALALGSLAACSHTPESGAAYRGHEYQYELAEKYRLGNGVEKDPSKAAYWYYKAATSPGWSASRGVGHNGARMKLAEIYRNGEGVPKDYQQAVYWYQEALRKNDAPGPKYQIGELYRTGGPNLPKDEAAALQWYREAAEEGMHWAQYQLGEAYRMGTGVEKDLDEAIRFYEMSARQENHWAQLRLSESFRSGEGKPRDVAAANDLLRRSAAQGNHWAMLTMGDIYRNGDGVDKDLREAAEWYSRSAQQGNKQAQRALAEIGQ